MRTFCSTAVPLKLFITALERLSGFVDTFQEVSFSCEGGAEGGRRATFPLSSEWNEVQPLGFSLGGGFSNPGPLLIPAWEEWVQRNEVWRKVPWEGGVMVSLSDRRHCDDRKGINWTLEWQWSYRFGEHVVVMPPLFFLQDNRDLAARVWNSGAEILRLPIHASPAERGFLLEATDEIVETIWPPQLPNFFDKMTMRIKPWSSREEFHRRVFELHEVGGKGKLSMSMEVSVPTERQARSLGGLEKWAAPNPEYLIAAWDSCQDWNSLEEKDYVLHAEPRTIAGFEQMCRLNRNRPLTGRLFCVPFAEEELSLGVWSERRKYGVYLAVPDSFSVDLKALEEAVQLKFEQRVLRWE